MDSPNARQQIRYGGGSPDPRETGARQHARDPNDPSAPSPTLDRRGFLRDSAGGSLALALATLLPAGCSADYPQAGQDGVPLKTLTDKEYAIVRAAAEALLDGVPADAATIAAAIDRELDLVGDPVRTDFKSMLGLIEHLTVLSLRRRTFTELPAQARLDYLEDWSKSRLALRRGAYQALRGFVVYFAYVRDETRAFTRFTGPLNEQVVIPVTPVDFGEVA